MSASSLQITIDGIDLAVTVSPTGEFSTRYEGEWYRSQTLVGLKKIMARAVRKESLGIPATMIEANYRNDQPQSVDIEITGIHAGNNNVLFRKAGETGASEQLRYGKIYRRFSPQEHEQCLKLWKAAQDAERVYEEFREAREIENIRQVLLAARKQQEQKS